MREKTRMITLDKVASESIFKEVTFKLRPERESHEKLSGALQAEERRKELAKVS